MLPIDDIIGISGTFFLILAYLVTTYKWTDNIILIDFLNLYGSFAVGFNCIYKKTYPPLILEVVWFVIALISLIKNTCCYKNQNNKILVENTTQHLIITNDNKPYYQTI